MIYQLYFKNDYNVAAFGGLYTKFDLSLITDKIYLPQINSEYVGMCYLWKNDIDNDNWIGFTSCRQIEKQYYNIISKEYIPLLSNYDIITWGWLCSGDSRFGDQPNLHTQSEFFHAGIINNIKILFDNCNESFNDIMSRFNISCGIYANYWIMSKENFNNFMEWSYPMAQFMSTNEDIYLNGTHQNMAGYILERLFIYWYLKNNKRIFIV